MTTPTSSVSEAAQFLHSAELQTLISTLAADGYQVIGPKVYQEAIVYDEIELVEELPRGWTDRQEPWQYRL